MYADRERIAAFGERRVFPEKHTGKENRKTLLYRRSAHPAAIQKGV